MPARRPGDTVVANGRTITAPRTGMTYVRAGELREVPIVSTAADRNTSVAITASEKGKRQMTTEVTEKTAEQIRHETVEFFGFDADPNVLAATWRVYFDYGAALAEYRAAYQAKGEA